MIIFANKLVYCLIHILKCNLKHLMIGFAIFAMSLCQPTVRLDQLVHVVRVKEQCSCNSTPDPFNGQTPANFILKPPKVIESRTYVKKANLENY